MNRVFFPILVVFLLITLGGCGEKKVIIDQINDETPQVLTLGVFHFNFPNLDAVQTAEDDQIDVLLPEYQKEIEMIVEKLLVFQPTIIAIELDPDYQSHIDTFYNRYLLGKYELKRWEHEQIGFRIAKAMGIQKLYCVNDWGSPYPNIINLWDNQENEEWSAFEKAFENDNNSTLKFRNKPLFKTEGILADLIQSNDEKNIKKDLGNYLLDIFKYESIPHDFTGVDFETGRWFNRNLRIFRNIQRIETDSSDRILVIFGSGHLNILNWLFDCSPEYTLVRTNDFLRK